MLAASAQGRFWPNAGGVLLAVPIRGLFHTAWALRVVSLRCRNMSGFGAKPEVADTMLETTLLTLSGAWPGRNLATQQAPD
jgi:hypothetical protein